MVTQSCVSLPLQTNPSTFLKSQLPLNSLVRFDVTLILLSEYLNLSKAEDSEYDTKIKDKKLEFLISNNEKFWFWQGFDIQFLKMTVLPLVLSLKDNCPTKYNLKTNLRQLFPPSFKSTIKSSIIKAVTQTQFKTCVTAFIALDFKLRQEKLSRWNLRWFPCLKTFFNDSKMHFDT